MSALAELDLRRLRASLSENVTVTESKVISLSEATSSRLDWNTLLTLTAEILYSLEVVSNSEAE